MATHREGKRREMATRREKGREEEMATHREGRVSESKRHSCMGRTLSAFERHKLQGGGTYSGKYTLFTRGACEVAHPYCQGLFTQFLHSFMKSVIVAS